MNCPTCSCELPGSAAFCHQCGASIRRRSSLVVYAGFWRRVGAVLIDLFLMAPVYFLCKELLLTPSERDRRLMESLMSSRVTEADRQAALMMSMSWFANFAIIMFVTLGFYYVLTECSPMQGTLGKRMLRLGVTDLNGNRIGFGRALMRYVCRMLSALPWQMGFLMAAFGRKKQALHDILGGTLVVLGEKDAAWPAVPHALTGKPAAFWRRAAASVIDFVLVMSLLAVPVQRYLPADERAYIRQTSGFFGDRLSDTERDAFKEQVLSGVRIRLALLFVTFGLYFVLAEASPLEGTLGKRLLGIRVADLQGRRISLGRALGRYLARWIAAGTWLAGFGMAAFTRNKQGLHDIIAGTAVLSSRSAHDEDRSSARLSLPDSPDARPPHEERQSPA